MRTIFQGVQPSLEPEVWRRNDKYSATIAYDVYYPDGHDFISKEYLPGFYFDGEVEI